MKNFTLIIVFLFIGINYSTAQETTETVISKTLPEGYTTVTGVVNDNMEIPLPSANVKVKGTKGLPVQTNFDGEFSIAVKQGDKLEFSYVGMKTHVITISAQENYYITLEDDIIDTGLVIYCGPRMRGVASIYMFGY